MMGSKDQHHSGQVLNVNGLQRLVDEVERDGMVPAAMERFIAEFPRELAKVRRQAGLTPVRINGSREKGLKQGYFQMRLRDGTTGYFQRRTDDCIQAVTASLLQMPPYKVPDLRFDAQRIAGKDLEEIERNEILQWRRWKAKHGLRIFSHATPPRTARRWIGVVTKPGEGGSNDHVLLMSGPDVLFDPAHLLPPRRDQDAALEGYTVADIDYGLTIERR